MSEDRQVLREVWEGRVPVCFSLADNETTSISAPEPVYLLVPRLSYFPLVLEKVRRHFVRHVSDELKKNEPWLQCEGYSLPWHQPIGLQFDMLGLDPPLPWHVTVHFTPPLQHHHDLCVKRDALESFYLSTVKEADQLRHGGNLVSQLTRRDHNQLWAGLISDKFEQFWSVNRRLLPSCDSSATTTAVSAVATTSPSSGSGCKLRSIPVRLYLPDRRFVQRPISPVSVSSRRSHSSTSSGSSSVATSCSPSSPARDLSHQLLTFAQLVVKLFETAVSVQLIEPLPLAQVSYDSLHESGFQFLVHGVEPPAETPLLWLSCNFSYADNFLHIVTVSSSTQ